MLNDFGEYDDELTQKIRLKTIKRISIGISFTKAKHIVSEKNIISKEHYYTICDIDNRLSKEPEILKKSKAIPYTIHDKMIIQSTSPGSLK